VEFSLQQLRGGLKMNDNFPVIHRDLTLLTPLAQEGLPVPLADWNKLQERITEIKDPTARLEAFGWVAIGAAISFFAVAISLPFSVEWSKIIANVERINWPAILTEGSAIFLTLSFLASGWLALYWAGAKQRLQAKMGEWLVQDMKSFQDLHSPAQRARSA